MAIIVKAENEITKKSEEENENNNVANVASKYQ
jgi:hypothetical protein